LKLLRLAAPWAAAFPLVAAAAGAADPAATVPRLAYESALGTAPGGVEQGTIDWKKANADVAQFPRGHADLLKWEESQGAQPAAPPVPSGHPHHGG